MEKYYDILNKMPLFQGIVKADMSSLLHCLSATVKSYGKNEMIFMAGEKVVLVGVLCVGKVQIVKEDFGGNRTILTELKQGDLFGEAFACAKTEKLPVSVYSVMDSEVLFIDYRKVITTCSTSCIFHGKLIENMLRIISIKNVMLNQKIEVLSKRSTREKLMTYLSQQGQRAGEHSFTIPFDRQELADYLCVDRSAMSSELSKLRNEGILEYERSRFILKKIYRKE